MIFIALVDFLALKYRQAKRRFKNLMTFYLCEMIIYFPRDPFYLLILFL